MFTNIDYLLPPMCSVPRLLICRRNLSSSQAQRPPSTYTSHQLCLSSLLSSRFWAEEACLSSHHLPLSKAFKLTLKKNPSLQRKSTTAFHYLPPLPAKLSSSFPLQDVLHVQIVIHSFSHSHLAARSQWVLGGSLEGWRASCLKEESRYHSDADLSLLSGSLGRLEPCKVGMRIPRANCT